MRLTYDPRHNIAYLRLREKAGQVETIRVSDELNIDIAPDGTVYGVEFLNANAQLKDADGGRLVYLDEASGQRQEISLATRPASGKSRTRSKQKSRPTLKQLLLAKVPRADIPIPPRGRLRHRKPPTL